MRKKAIFFFSQWFLLILTGTFCSIWGEEAPLFAVSDLRYEVRSRYEPKTNELFENFLLEFLLSHHSLSQLLFYHPEVEGPFNVRFFLDSVMVNGISSEPQIDGKIIRLDLAKPLNAGVRHRVRLFYRIRNVSAFADFMKEQAKKNPLASWSLPGDFKKMVFTTINLFPRLLEFDKRGAKYPYVEELTRLANFHAWITLPESLRARVKGELLSTRKNLDGTLTYEYLLRNKKLFHWGADES